jgi:hypothetical protein
LAGGATNGALSDIEPFEFVTLSRPHQGAPSLHASSGSIDRFTVNSRHRLPPSSASGSDAGTSFLSSLELNTDRYSDHAAGAFRGRSVLASMADGRDVSVTQQSHTVLRLRSNQHC